MNLPQPFNTAPRRVHRKRRQELPSSGPATVSVVSVVFISANSALWTFSSALVGDPESVGGLLIDGQEAGGADGETPEGAIVIDYDDPIAAGQSWSCVAGEFIGTFANGGTLVNGSGVVAAA